MADGDWNRIYAGESVGIFHQPLWIGIFVCIRSVSGRKRAGLSFCSGRLYHQSERTGFPTLYHDDGAALVCTEDHEKSGWQRGELPGRGGDRRDPERGIVGDDGISATWHYKCSIYGGAGKHLSDCVCLCDAVGTALPFI